MPVTPTVRSERIWHAKEVVRKIYTITDPELADPFVTRLGLDLQDRSHPQRYDLSA
jgi:hypothetical protein